MGLNINNININIYYICNLITYEVTVANLLKIKKQQLEKGKN